MSAIYIRCKLPRPDGTPVTMADGTEYKFTRNADGVLVAVVSNKEHQARLLSISEGYEFYASADIGGGALAAAVVAQAPVAAPISGQPVMQQESAPALQTGAPAAAVTMTDGTVPAPATQDAPKAPESFNPANSTSQEHLVAWAEADAANAAQLRQMHTTELGAEPRANAKIETIVAKLIAKRTA